jgi:hypothetical protein
VLLVGSTPSFVHTIGRILSEHGYGVAVKAWTDDLRPALADPPRVIVMHGVEITTVAWSLLGWVHHDPVARRIPVLVCAETIELLPYAVRALCHRPGLVVASSLERNEFLAKFSALLHVDTLLERGR